jgi:undecaprenyl-diphosphatase
MNNIEAWNQTLFLEINASLNTPVLALQTMAVIADDLIFIIPILLLSMWLSGEYIWRKIALKSFLVTFFALGLNQLIALIWQHPRPDAMGLGHTFITHAQDSSFPSDHMTVFSSIGITLLLGHSKNLGISVLLMALLVAWSRVALGAHFPLDMVGAVIVSGISYLAITLVWLRLGKDLTEFFVMVYRRIFTFAISRGWLRN